MGTPLTRTNPAEPRQMPRLRGMSGVRATSLIKGKICWSRGRCLGFGVMQGRTWVHRSSRENPPESRQVPRLRGDAGAYLGTPLIKGKIRRSRGRGLGFGGMQWRTLVHRSSGKSSGVEAGCIGFGGSIDRGGKGDTQGAHWEVEQHLSEEACGGRGAWDAGHSVLAPPRPPPTPTT